ncbi:SAM-dependent methyltransferase [Paraburkholderia bonniea]|uniref:SAM-dependent methyltransferase n=1 Tax=Paraburkholderia bonniea TaxID=2152891 RepID=UPI001FE93373|nr:SAM-dependent methyltransferase [Paraburkholderia bonniea]WJF91515.1 SAM-dependent methyltransferase [Paraburkholderia bonniea]WJF94834.1 SAM-dependent methyltransferase [Paraburkholderia bonniea]
MSTLPETHEPRYTHPIHAWSEAAAAPGAAAGVSSESRIAFVRQQIHAWLDELLALPASVGLQQSFGKMLTLRNYILSPVLNASETARYLEDPEVRDYMARYQALCALNEVRFEREMSAILRGQNESEKENEALVQIIRGYYADIYKLLARSEIFLSGMNPTSNVVMVGSGGMPLSLLFMQSFSGARVTGVERSAASLASGSEYIAFLSGQHPALFRRAAISQVCADGVSFDYGEADIVVLSIHLADKLSIIERIIETTPRERAVVIVERQVRGLGQYFYRNHGFEPAGLPLQRMGTLCSSLLESTAYRLVPRG